jgi:hypothetical protein
LLERAIYKQGGRSVGICVDLGDVVSVEQPPVSLLNRCSSIATRAKNDKGRIFAGHTATPLFPSLKAG